ncbi:Crp/Fnr family transcriptional regulator [Flavisolibacter ginsengisoli]|jgi:CRP-like cAMP-binding protein|uniref:cAMP-binding domain of CRP or a regulatory subunit of cAMP-dependent protein kinases n=1 Tax=Flavisolibacter ginsengisoli DSM 18119 TaxID=1121884 RepID=A0A1M5AQ49_9BACT|nr:Crp/Fnr family transcriptional regulator [Flavisolibacter ginsengisoli]SHF32286.1 cAMP-binding domain of CRP or a regulatory subunit of cAMP-dependent protein kinases [Flavisolibacter ginsengisoli DSM 18119]
MFELLHQKFAEKISLTEEEFNYCKSLFKPKKLRKRQYFLQEGDVCKYQAFIEKGILRSYTIDEKGSEHILQFATEGWWMADLSSYVTGESSLFNIQAIEASELLLISKPSWDELMLSIPKFEHYFRILIQNHLVATQKRLMQSLSETAEEKYNKFSKTYPDCLQRVPKHMIASYLGVSRETLSRLRKNIIL